MIDALKFSINSIFDFYRQKIKGFYNFSLGFIALSAVYSVVISITIILISDKFGILPKYQLSHNNSIGEFLLDSLTSQAGRSLLESFAILSLGLYAIYLKGQLQNDQKSSVKGFLKALSTKDWTMFMFVALIVCVIQVITIDGPFYSNQNEKGLLGTINIFYQETWKIRLFKWLDSIINLIKDYLPYIGALYLVMNNIKDRPGQQLLKNAKTILLPVLILSFCANTIGGEVFYYFHKYIITLFYIPFRDNISPGILGIVAYIIMTAYFVPAVAGAVLFPVLNGVRAQNVEPLEDTTEPEELPNSVLDLPGLE